MGSSSLVDTEFSHLLRCMVLPTTDIEQLLLAESIGRERETTVSVVEREAVTRTGYRVQERQ